MIDQRILDAYRDYLDGLARLGILECDAPAEGQAVEAWLVEKLRVAGRLPEGWEEPA